MVATSGSAVSKDLDIRLLRFRSGGSDEDGLALAEALLAAERYADVVEVCGDARCSDASPLASLLLEGRAWIKQGDLLRAQSSFVRAARLAPQSYEPFQYLGEVLLKRGDPDRALTAFERALNISPENAEVLQLRDRAARLSKVVEEVSPGSEASAVKAKTAARPSGTERLTLPNMSSAAAGGNSTAEDAGQPARVDRDGSSPRPSLPRPAQSLRKKKTDLRSPALGEIDKKREKGSHGFRDSIAALRRVIAESSPISSKPPKSPITQEQRPDGTRERLGRAPTQAVTDPAASGVEDKQGKSGPRLSKDLPGRRQAQPAGSSKRTNTTKPSGKVSQKPKGRGVPAAALRPTAPSNAPPGYQAASSPGLPDSNAPTLQGVGAAAPAVPAAAIPSQESSARDDVPSAYDSLAIGDTQLSVRPPASEPESEEADDHEAQSLASAEAERLDLGAKDLGLSPSGAGRSAVPRRSRRSLWVGIAAAVCLIAGAGTWFWFAQRGARADAFQEEARTLALSGRYQALLAARDLIKDSIELKQSRPSVLLALRIELQLAIENGESDLRPVETLALKQSESKEPSVRLARALLALRSSRSKQAITELLALKTSGVDRLSGHEAYLLGRLLREAGLEGDIGVLEQALRSKPSVPVAGIALAEHAYIRGDEAGALEYLKRDGLKASADTRVALLQELFKSDSTSSQVKFKGEVHGKANTAYLQALEAAAFLKKKKELQGNEVALRAISSAQGIPVVLGVLSRKFATWDLHGLTVEAAKAALEVAPTEKYARLVLADAYLARRNPPKALSTLGPLAAEEPLVVRRTVLAALQLGTERALESAKRVLDASTAGLKNVPEYESVLQLNVGSRLEPRRTGRWRKQLEQRLDGLSDKQALLLAGRMALELRDADIAESVVDALRAMHGVDSDMLVIRAKTALLQGEVDKARMSLAKAVSLTPWHYEARREYASLLRLLGNYEQSSLLYAKLISDVGWGAESLELLTLRAEYMMVLVESGETEQARKILNDLPIKEREAPVVRPVEASILLAENEASKAVEKLRTIAESPNATAATLVLYGHALAVSGDWEESSEQFLKAIRVDRKSIDGLIGMTESNIRAESSSRALYFVERLLESLKTQPATQEQRATAHYLMGRTQLLRRSKYKEEALDWLRKAVEMQGVPNAAWFFIGEAESSESKAKKAYKTYLELEPKGQYASRAKRRL